jgi:flagellar basal body-associated protein FliL
MGLVPWLLGATHVATALALPGETASDAGERGATIAMTTVVVVVVVVVVAGVTWLMSARAWVASHDGTVADPQTYTAAAVTTARAQPPLVDCMASPTALGFIDAKSTAS